MKKLLVTCVVLFSVFSTSARSHEQLAETGKPTQTTQQAAASASVSQTSTPTPGAVNATTASYKAAKIELTEGDVRLYDTTNNMRKPQLGDAVNQGDSIITGADGEIHLAMEDGGFIAVRPNTMMRISNYRAEGDDDDQGVFGLLRGSFRSITGWIGRHSARRYVVRTPTATIGVRGTDHEPTFIEKDGPDGEAGTYDKVNDGSSFIKTDAGSVDIPSGKSAFAPHKDKTGKFQPRLLDQVPHFFRATRNEHLIEKRREFIRNNIDRLREDRRKRIGERIAEVQQQKAGRLEKFKAQREARGKHELTPPHEGDATTQESKREAFAERRKARQEMRKAPRERADENTAREKHHLQHRGRRFNDG